MRQPRYESIAGQRGSYAFNAYISSTFRPHDGRRIFDDNHRRLHAIAPA